jgi:hypothetical protein
MEQVLARAALFAGQLLVGADDGVADGALGLAFQGADDVAAPGDEAIDQVAVLRLMLAVRFPKPMCSQSVN